MPALSQPLTHTPTHTPALTPDVLCACGCGQVVPAGTVWARRMGRPNQFLRGHNMRLPESRERRRARCVEAMLDPAWKTFLADRSREALTGRTGPEANAWGADAVGVSAAHMPNRLGSLAKNHPCVCCGEPAKDWSLSWRTAQDLRVGIRDDKPTWFSLHPSDYEPRCRPCHRQYDKGQPHPEVLGLPVGGA